MKLTGRASRQAFAITFAGYIALALISLLLSFTLPNGIGVAVNWPLSIIATWFRVAAGVRRQHDLDKSGWLILLWIIPIVGVVFLACWFVRAGTVGPNRYGPSPSV